MLEVHREYKQVLVDILNVLLTAVTAGVKFFTTGDWRFFKTNTDSMNIVNDINKNIADLSNDKGPGAAAGNGG